MPGSDRPSAIRPRPASGRRRNLSG